MNIRDRLKYTKVFEFDFLKVGREYEFQHDPSHEILRGVLQEMFVNRDDEDDLWVSFILENDGLTYDFRAADLSFDEERLDEQEDLPPYPVKFVRAHINAMLPVYSTNGSSGMDFFAVEEVFVQPGESAQIRTGLKIELPLGFDMKMSARSSLGRKGLIIGNAPGIIDNDYRGEIIFAVWNVSKQTIIVRVGDKIGQGVLAPVFQGTPMFVESLSETARGDGGFGSTGK